MRRMEFEKLLTARSGLFSEFNEREQFAARHVAWLIFNDARNSLYGRQN